jgi:hypothetical protein
MSVKIIKQPTNYLLIGASRGLLLTVDCSEQLSRYNQDNNLLDVDYQLLNSFAAANDTQSLTQPIDSLIQNYGLHRRPAFTSQEFAPILSQSLGQIRQLPAATAQTIDNLTGQFQQLRESFSQQLNRNTLLPDVTLSKLLHFVHPSSFWILDSRVKTILDIWGYRTSYEGFGEFLSDLFRDPDFDYFRTFLEEQNAALVAQHQIHGLPCSLLKLVDKLLWFTQD